MKRSATNVNGNGSSGKRAKANNSNYNFNNLNANNVNKIKSSNKYNSRYLNLPSNINLSINDIDTYLNKLNNEPAITTDEELIAYKIFLTNSLLAAKSELEADRNVNLTDDDPLYNGALNYINNIKIVNSQLTFPVGGIQTSGNSAMESFAPRTPGS